MTPGIRTVSSRPGLTRHARSLSAFGDKSAPNLVDGAVLIVQLGGHTGYLETDALALRFNGPIRVGEIKSFPVVDGRADPAKVGAAADQSAVYVLALEDLVAQLGGEPDKIVSSEILLITPLNTGMQPVLHVVDVSRRVAHHRRQLSGAPDLEKLIARIPEGLAFPGGKHPDPVAALSAIAVHTGTSYGPSCLSFCGAARWCRARAREAGDPACLGEGAARLLPGIATLDRAVEISNGAMPDSNENVAVESLRRATRLIEKRSASLATRGGPGLAP
jgi:hypothetical protein